MRWTGLLLLGLTQACDVPVIRPTEIGIGDAVAPSGDAGCPQGVVVAATNQTQSANIGVMSLTGQVLSPSVLSTASHAPGLTAALGGDLAFASTFSSNTEVVVIDRHPGGVLTWLDLRTATVRAQLSVATGFPANPHDYVPLSNDKAYVTRFDANANPGRQVYDAGSDVLIVDPSTPAIVGRIDVATALPRSSDAFVHPDRARRVRDKVLLVAPFYDAAYDYSGPDRGHA
jgi:hypothetical protein